MYSKLMWLLTGILTFVFVPLKVTSVFSPLEFVDSAWFAIAFFALVGIIYLLTRFSNKIQIDNLEVRRNIPLGILSVLIAVGFFFCISSYYGANVYDFEWQPIIMSFLSIFSLIAFLIMAFAHFTGKNLFESVVVFLFFPVLWFAFDLILFLSIQNDNSDIYDISLTAFLALFFLYYTQVYSTASKRNIIKLLISFGIPAFVLAFAKCIPTAIRYIGDYSDLPTKIEFATFIMESAAGLYVLMVVIEAFKQISETSSEN